MQKILSFMQIAVFVLTAIFTADFSIRAIEALDKAYSGIVRHIQLISFHRPR